LVDHQRHQGDGQSQGQGVRPAQLSRWAAERGPVVLIKEAAAEIEKQSFDEVWASIVDTLESEHRTCQKNKIEVYKNCLLANSGETTDWLDLVAIIKTHRVALLLPISPPPTKFWPTLDQVLAKTGAALCRTNLLNFVAAILCLGWMTMQEFLKAWINIDSLMKNN
jgi:hypothetical protein